MYALEVNHVSKNYGSFKALDNVEFKIEQGDFVGLLGVNGAGKTSLISSISGLNKFNGQIKIMGHDVITDTVNAKYNLGVVPQEIAFDPFLTVYQTLKFQSGLYGVKNNKEWLDEVIERVHLKDKVHANTRALSGGMKRRLMVAQALVHKPPVIILDEPTAGVDVEIRKSLWSFITELHKEGHTILLTTHYLEEVEKLCNKIVMINKGQVIAKSGIKEFINQASSIPTRLQIDTENGAISDDLKDLIISHEDNSYLLKLENSSNILPILSSLQNSDIKVINIQIHQPSIEDVFINYLHR